MKKLNCRLIWGSACLLISCMQTIQAQAEKPNIVYIFADDLGYGDVQCLNPERGKIATPNLDRIAGEGMLFTDAHSGSSVCTPTRYGILTGRYCWRTRLQKRVLYGYDKPLIDSERLTVAGFLKTQGYSTACIGKWHLGMDVPTRDGKAANERQTENIDWEGTVRNGPVSVGFDYFYGIAASLDMHPYIYIQDDGFVGTCTTEKAFHRNGPAHEDFEAIDVLPHLGSKAAEYIRKQKPSQPFFAYVALTAPHTPILPTEPWQGRSGLGRYGDFVMQTDAVIGEVVAAIDEAGLRENTVLIVTADNGCSKAARIPDLHKKGHYPSAQFRGAKLDLLEGGHRVPFFVRWPASVKAGTTCNQTICHTDLIATCADLLDATLPDNAGEDSVSLLAALKGQPIESTRAGIVHHAYEGYFAYRQGKWKLLLSRGSGGGTSPKEDEVPDDAPEAQLFDLENDPAELTNLYESRPEIAQRLLQQLQADVQRGRSTEGANQKNDVDEIVLWKNRK